MQSASKTSSKTPKATILALHGWTQRADTKTKWQPLLDNLAAAGFAVKFLQLPGLKTQLDRPWHLEDYCQWLLQAMAAYESVILIGHSFGGQIAAAVAATRPNNLQQLVLIDPAGMRDRSWIKQLKRTVFRAAAKLGKGILNLVGSVSSGQQGSAVANDDRGSWEKAARFWLYKLAGEQDYYQASPVLKQTMINVLSKEITERLKQIQVPSLIIWGEQDRTTPLKHAQIFKQKIRHSRLAVIKQAGHNPHYFYPGKTAHIILEFLRST
jgi:pimeloyl-ACP methyl ester carboxylesterase